MRTHSDDSFEIYEGDWSPPTTCLAVRSGVVDFPPRCVGVIGHSGQHRTAPLRVMGQPPFAPIYWNDDE